MGLVGRPLFRARPSACLHAIGEARRYVGDAVQAGDPGPIGLGQPLGGLPRLRGRLGLQLGTQRGLLGVAGLQRGDLQVFVGVGVAKKTLQRLGTGEAPAHAAADTRPGKYLFAVLIAVLRLNGQIVRPDRIGHGPMPFERGEHAPHVVLHAGTRCIRLHVKRLHQEIHGETVGHDDARPLPLHQQMRL